MQKNIFHNINSFAYLLISISIALIFTGVIIQISVSSRTILDPVDDVVLVNEDDSTVHIDKPISTTVSKDEEKNNKHKNQKNILEINNLETLNKNILEEIETKYGIVVLFGEDTIGYSVGGIDTVPLDSNESIYEALSKIKKCLNNYPSDLFLEIKNGGIPLTIVLIKNYFDMNVTGVTDSSYSYAKISLATIHPLEESFYHESYHYIERFLLKKGANFNNWNSLNPVGFRYGQIYSSNSYSNSFLENAPFVNNYAQTMDTEDRASTFEYMMAEEKANCFNKGQIIWRKALNIARTMEYVLDSVKPTVTEYWERFL